MKIYPLTKVALASVTFLLLIILVGKFDDWNCTKDFRFDTDRGWRDGLYELKISYSDVNGLTKDIVGIWPIVDNEIEPWNSTNQTHKRLIEENSGIFSLMLIYFEKRRLNECGEILDSNNQLKIMPLRYDDAVDDQYRY